MRIELTEVERAIQGLESAQHAVRDESETAHEELSAHEVKLAENRQRVQFLTEEVLREFQTAVGTVDWKLQLWRADDEPEGLKPLDLDEDDDEGGEPKVVPLPAEATAASDAGGGPGRGGVGAQAADGRRRRRGASRPRTI